MGPEDIAERPSHSYMENIPTYACYRVDIGSGKYQSVGIPAAPLLQLTDT